VSRELFKGARKYTKSVITLGVGIVGVIYALNVLDESNVKSTVSTATPVLPYEQKIPVENTPVPYENDFKGLFEKLSVQEIKPEKPIDHSLVKNFIQQAGQLMLSEDAITTEFSGRFGKRGVQKSIILDSKDRRSSVALSTHLQGKGATADIRVLKVIMINRDTNESVALWLSDLKEGERTVFVSSKLSKATNFSYWDEGKALYYYFPEIEAAKMEDLSFIIDLLKSGKVNVDLTKKSTYELDKKYNKENPVPLKPQPTPKISGLN